MDNDGYSVRAKLDNVEKEIKKLSEEILQLTVINKFFHEERQNNSTKIDRIDSEVTAAKGAVSLMRWIISIFGTSIIGFCVYIVSNDIEYQQKLSNQAEKIARLESRIERNITDIQKLENALENKP